MYRLNTMIVVVLCVPFYALNAANVDSIANEETTDTMMIDVYAPSSDETFDPQKDYADFKTSYEKLYKISGSPYELPSMKQQQQQQQQNIKSMHDSQVAATVAVDDVDNESDDTTNSSDIGSDANDLQTTIPPPIEQQTIIQLLAENVGMRSINDIMKSTQRPIAYASFKQSAPNAEFVKQKPNPTFDHMNNNNNNNNNNNYNNDNDNNDKDNEDSVNEMGEPIEQDTVDNLPNEVTIRNESSDYVNDEAAAAAADSNYTQPITVKSYAMETTMAAILPTPPVFVSTRTPINTLIVNTPTSVTVAAAPTIAAAASAATAPTASTTDEITPNQTTGKKSKKIEALPRIYKYSADEIVRKYLDDSYLRAPLATLINTAPEPLRKTKLLWKSALRPNTPINIVLVAFNSSGVGVTYSFKNTRTMIAGLESVQESREMFGGGSGFYGILRASELIPYDSAIFISTDKIPQDISLMKNAATILLKKRIRLYLIWFGDQSNDENETSIGGSLGEVALRSGGEILQVTEESLGNGETGLVTHFLQNDIQGAQVLEIPVNKTDRNLHVKIQGYVDEAKLSTPNDGLKIDLLNVKSVRDFSNGSVAVYVPNNQYNNRPETIINLNVTNAPNGIYTLKIMPTTIENGTQDNFYNLLVNTEFVQLDEKDSIDTTADILRAIDLQPNRKKRSENLSEETVDKEVVFPEHQTENPFDVQTITNTNTNTNDTDVGEARSGKNILQALTKIDLGAQSQLLANPGSTVQIHYEITNLRDVPTFHNFQVIDERSFLRSLAPVSMWLPPGQTRNAVVMCYIPPNIDIGTKDKITFSSTSQGMNIASQSAMLTVTSPVSAGMDRTPPKIYWNYGSRCYGRTEAGRCAGSIWSLEITTIDTDTGILRVQSTPRGLLIRDQYIAGTTQEVKATYSASCCAPRVSITSYDLAGNQKTITLDVTEYYLEPIEIVAIVLGVILLIILIAAIVWAIIYFVKKRRNTRELPVYRSRSDRERAT